MNNRKSSLDNLVRSNQTKMILGVLAAALIGFAVPQQVRADDDNSAKTKEEKTTISLNGSQQFNPCVSETVTITRGKDVIRTKTQNKTDGRIRIETSDNSEGEGFGDVSQLRYEYNELFNSKTESSETTFELRFDHKKHLIRQRDNPHNDDYFQREEQRLKVVNGVTKVEKSRSTIECR